LWRALFLKTVHYSSFKCSERRETVDLAGSVRRFLHAGSIHAQFEEALLSPACAPAVLDNPVLSAPRALHRLYIALSIANHSDLVVDLPPFTAATEGIFYEDATSVHAESFSYDNACTKWAFCQNSFHLLV
jgi:hypothetical protein